MSNKHRQTQIRYFYKLLLPALLFLAACTSTPPSVIEGQSELDYGAMLTAPEDPILLGAPLTRLFVDAQTTAEWRSKGFHAVLAEDASTQEERLEQSVLYQLLRLKQMNPQPRFGMLPDSMDISLDLEQICTTREKFDKYAKKHPGWGMPYAMPNLSDREYRTLVQWLSQGAPATPAPTSTDVARAQIVRWEAFLNDRSLKQQLSSRYLYEHLFQAHIHLAARHGNSTVWCVPARRRESPYMKLSIGSIRVS